MPILFILLLSFFLSLSAYAASEWILINNAPYLPLEVVEQKLEWKTIYEKRTHRLIVEIPKKKLISFLLLNSEYAIIAEQFVMNKGFGCSAFLILHENKLYLAKNFLEQKGILNEEEKTWLTAAPANTAQTATIQNESALCVLQRPISKI